MSEPGGVSQRTSVKEEAISQDRAWKLLSTDSCLWGGGWGGSQRQRQGLS